MFALDIDPYANDWLEADGHRPADVVQPATTRQGPRVFIEMEHFLSLSLSLARGGFFFSAAVFCVSASWMLHSAWIRRCQFLFIAACTFCCRPLYDNKSPIAALKWTFFFFCSFTFDSFWIGAGARQRTSSWLSAVSSILARLPFSQRWQVAKMQRPTREKGGKLLCSCFLFEFFSDVPHFFEIFFFFFFFFF